MQAFKWTVLISVAGLIATSAAAQKTGSTTIDQVVATVDKEAILLSDVLTEMGPQLGEIRRKATSDEDFQQQLQKQIHATLEQAIENRVMLRQAQTSGITVTDDELARRLEDYKKLFPSIEDFNKELEGSGQTLTELRERLRKQILARKMAVQKMKEFQDAVTVAESDVAQYYKDHLADYQHLERVHAFQIFLPAGQDAKVRATVKARLEQLRSEIESGSEFEDLATQYSQAPGAKDGGLIGWVSRGDLVHALEDAAFALKPGEMSEVVETDNGFHVIKVDKKEAAGVAKIEDVRKDIEPKLRSVAATAHFKTWIDELKRRSSVQVFI